MPASKLDVLEAGAKVVAVVALPILAKFATRKRRVVLQPENQATGSSEKATEFPSIAQLGQTVASVESDAKTRVRQKRIDDILERARKFLGGPGGAVSDSSVWNEMDGENLDATQFKAIKIARGVRENLLKATSNRVSVAGCEDGSSVCYGFDQINAAINMFGELEVTVGHYMRMRNSEYTRILNMEKNPDTVEKKIFEPFKKGWGMDTSTFDFETQKIKFTFKQLIDLTNAHLRDIETLNEATKALGTVTHPTPPSDTFKQMRARGGIRETTALKNYKTAWQEMYNNLNKQELDNFRKSETERVSEAMDDYKQNADKAIKSIQSGSVDVSAFENFNSSFRSRQVGEKKDKQDYVRKLHEAHNGLLWWSLGGHEEYKKKSDELKIRYQDRSLFKLPQIQHDFERVNRTFIKKIKEATDVTHFLRYFATNPRTDSVFLQQFDKVVPNIENHQKNSFYNNVKNKVAACRKLYELQSEATTRGFKAKRDEIQQYLNSQPPWSENISQAVLKAALKMYNEVNDKVKKNAMTEITKAFNEKKDTNTIAEIAAKYDRQLMSGFNWLRAPADWGLQPQTVDYSNQTEARIHAEEVQIQRDKTELLGKEWTDDEYKKAKMLIGLRQSADDGDEVMRANHTETISTAIQQYETIEELANSKGDIYEVYNRICVLQTLPALQVKLDGVRAAIKKRVAELAKTKETEHFDALGIGLKGILEFDKNLSFPQFVLEAESKVTIIKGLYDECRVRMESISKKSGTTFNGKVLLDFILKWRADVYYPKQERFIDTFVEGLREKLLAAAESRSVKGYDKWVALRKTQLRNYGNQDELNKLGLHPPGKPTHKKIADCLIQKVKYLERTLEFPTKTSTRRPQNVKHYDGNFKEDKRQERVQSRVDSRKKTKWNNKFSSPGK